MGKLITLLVSLLLVVTLCPHGCTVDAVEYTISDPTKMDIVEAVVKIWNGLGNYAENKNFEKELDIAEATHGKEDAKKVLEGIREEASTLKAKHLSAGIKIKNALKIKNCNTFNIANKASPLSTRPILPSTKPELTLTRP